MYMIGISRTVDGVPIILIKYCIYFQRAHQSLYKNSYLQVHKMFSSLQHQYDYVYKYSNPTYNKAPFLPIALDMGHSKFSQFNIFC